MRPAVFFDRDGTLVHDTGYVHRVEDLAFLPGAIDALATLKREGFLLIVATNQSGVALGRYDEAAVDAFHAAMNAQLTLHGAALDAFYFCPFHPNASVAAYRRESDLRKPGIGMFELARRDFDVEVAASYMVGDRRSDMEFASSAGLRGILVCTGQGAADATWATTAGFAVEPDLAAAAAKILGEARNRR